MSPELKEFYQLYKEWLDVKAPELEPFSRKKGLRQNLLMVLMPIDHTASLRLLDEMQLSMIKAHVHLSRSFCETHEAVSAERINATCHENPKRIEWVEARTKE